MRRLLVILAFVCAGSQATAQVGGRQPEANSPVGVVAQLYRDYSWEMVFDLGTRWPVIQHQSRTVLERYFDENLTRLFLQNQACENRGNGECALSGSSLWDSNDPSAADLRVEQTRDSNVVTVSFRIVQGKRKTLAYLLARAPRGWRIADVRYQGGYSLAGRLKSK